jgi:hypothetical protein
MGAAVNRIKQMRFSSPMKGYHLLHQTRNQIEGMKGSLLPRIGEKSYAKLLKKVTTALPEETYMRGLKTEQQALYNSLKNKNVEAAARINSSFHRGGGAKRTLEAGRRKFSDVKNVPLAMSYAKYVQGL